MCHGNPSVTMQTYSIHDSPKKKSAYIKVLMTGAGAAERAYRSDFRLRTIWIS